MTIDDRYELTARLGSGGMGEVWAGFDRKLNRKVAVKLLMSGGIADGLESLRERFEREAQLLARIGHPTIPEVYDVGSDSGRAYMIMQLIEGRTLGLLLERQGPPGWTRSLRFAIQICGALSAAHQEAVVHRDLKPENLMIDVLDRVWLLDFGVAASLAPTDPRLTMVGMASPGTAQYASPEQHLGEREITGASDLYALGCVLHELIAGEPLFVDSAARSIRAQHLQNAPVPLRELRPETPAELELLVLALLSKQPGDRPASAATVEAALAEILAEHGAALDDRRPAPAPRRPRSALPEPTVPFDTAAAPTADAAGANAPAADFDAAAAPTADLHAANAPTAAEPAVRSDGIAGAAPVLARPSSQGYSAVRDSVLADYLDGRPARALPGLRLLLRRAHAEQGPGTPESVDLALVLADLLVALGELAEAEACLREALRHCPPRAVGGTSEEGGRDEARLRRLDVQHLLGRTLLAQGDPEGLTLLTGTLDSLLPVHGESDPEVRSLRTLLDTAAA
ncbi:protein kinase domain-containing protein [Streptomyces populi]